MNKKGGIFRDYFVHIVAVAFLLGIIFLFVWNQLNGAGVWGDFYAKEIVKTIEGGKVGDYYELDVHKATQIALDNEVRSFSEVFEFDNSNNEFCVKLSPGKESCFSWFNDVNVEIIELTLGRPINVLKFKIVDKPGRANA